MTREDRKQGKLFIVGIGPGDIQQMTGAVKQILQASEVIVGYRTYTDLIQELLEHQEVISTGMGGEIKRCHIAINAARDGKQVAMVCSGDPGVYGMAGLVHEILAAENTLADFPVEVLPGVPALCAAAALLGAPLMNDFASISLSDLLTPWEMIARRLEAAAQGDFVIILYNPRSRRRTEPLIQAQRIISQYRKPDTPVGVVTNAYRGESQVTLTNLHQMCKQEVGMRTIILVGNSSTFLSDDRMVTRRGYGNKYNLGFFAYPAG